MNGFCFAPKGEMHRQLGFTMIELMIVVLIIAVLAAIAVPAYSDYVRRARIQEIASALAQGRVDFERWFQDNRAYNAGASPCPQNRPGVVAYVCAPTAATFTITANGAGQLAGFQYAINEQNVRSSVTPWGNGATCWVTRKGESC